MPEMTADQRRVHRHAKLRAMRRVQPDWWVRSYDGDRERWNIVEVTMAGEKILTGRKFVRLLCTDRDNPTEGVEVMDAPNALVLCCTAVEAKRAGLVQRKATAAAEAGDGRA